MNVKRVSTEKNTFDVVGDVHGCYEELVALMLKLGYNHLGEHPEGRSLVLVGDIVDRGPNNKKTMLLVKSLVDSGMAHMVMGNHDNKFGRWLKGNKVTVAHGLEVTASEFEDYENKLELSEWILSLPTLLKLGDDLAVAHAAPGTRSQNLYGVVTGERDEEGRPIRIDWAKDYKSHRFFVYGHVMYDEPYFSEFACGIDTGCYETGTLSAFRWPEKEVVQVNGNT